MIIMAIFILIIIIIVIIIGDVSIALAIRILFGSGVTGFVSGNFAEAVVILIVVIAGSSRSLTGIIAGIGLRCSSCD